MFIFLFIFHSLISLCTPCMPGERRYKQIVNPQKSSDSNYMKTESFNRIIQELIKTRKAVEDHQNLENKWFEKFIQNNQLNHDIKISIKCENETNLSLKNDTANFFTSSYSTTSEVDLNKYTTTLATVNSQLKKTTLSSQNLLFTTTNTTNEYKEVTSTSRSNFKSCIHDKKCDTNNECIKGVCFEGKCRCRCSPFAHCIKNEDCLGRNLCSNKCISENGTSVNCHFKESCALGSQCLQGVCVGIGRYVRDAYEAISCNIENAEIDCQGYGSKSECTIELGVCIRHKNASEIGRNASNECQGGISATHGFPSCISYDDKPIKCGAKGNMQQCSRGSFCGLCKCSDF